MEKKVQGRVHKYGDDVNTDVIIPARYLNIHDMDELSLHCMEDIDPKFVSYECSEPPEVPVKDLDFLRTGALLRRINISGSVRSVHNLIRIAHTADPDV